MKKSFFKERRSKESFCTWSFCYIFLRKCRLGRIFAVPLWDLDSTNPADCDITMDWSFPCWNSGISTNFLTPYLSLLKPGHSAVISDLQVGKFDCLTQANMIAVNKILLWRYWQGQLKSRTMWIKSDPLDSKYISILNFLVHLLLCPHRTTAWWGNWIRI